MLDEDELIELVVAEIDEVATQNGAEGLADIREFVEREMRLNGPWLKSTIDSEVNSVRKLLLLGLSSCVEQVIKRDEYYIAKGELNDIGKRLLSLDDFVTEQLLLDGFHDENDAQKDRESIRAEIAVRG